MSALPLTAARKRTLPDVRVVPITGCSNRSKPGSLFGGSSAARAVALRRRRKRDRLTVMYVSADVFGVLRPAPNVRATGRQGPPCSGSTRSPKQRHARPKHLEVLAGTVRSGVLALSLPNSIAKCNHHHPPVMLRCFQASCRIGARLCENSGSARTRTRRFFGAAGGRARSVHLRQLGPSRLSELAGAL
jgi:hypothetical protein